MLGPLQSWGCIFVAVATIIFDDGCNAQTPSPTSVTGCITDYDEEAGIDYFPIKAEILYATTFSVEYFPTYKVLNTTDFSQTATYVLYQCGTPQPEVNFEVQEYISIPVTSVATGTSNHIPRIELLNERDTIKAFAGNGSLVVSSCIQEGLADGTIVEAVMMDEACGTVINNTALEEAGVEVTFSDDLFVSPYCSNANEPLYRAVVVFSFAEQGEMSGLAEGEAIKLFSLFYNAEEAANEIFGDIEFLWDCTTNNAQGCSLRLNDQPDVAWIPYVPTVSSWPDYATGWSAPATNVFYSTAINQAGGVMVECPLSSDSELMTDEEMISCLGNATICVFAADYAEVEAVMNQSALSQLACVQNERVYDITLSGINGWFEAKTVEPHVLVEDMVVVLHGDDFNYGLGDYERLLLRNVFTEESESGTYYTDEVCTDALVARELQGECELILDFETCDLTADESPASRAAPMALGALVTAALAALLPLMA